MSEVDETPRIKVMRHSRWRWETWVSDGLMAYAGEYGTYAFTRERAIKKGRRLMRKFRAIEAARESTFEVDE